LLHNPSLEKCMFVDRIGNISRDFLRIFTVHCKVRQQHLWVRKSLQKVPNRIISCNFVVQSFAIHFQPKNSLKQLRIIINVKSVEDNLNCQNFIVIILNFILKVISLALGTRDSIYLELRNTKLSLYICLERDDLEVGCQCLIVILNLNLFVSSEISLSGWETN
jgi:hypothetical protein